LTEHINGSEYSNNWAITYISPFIIIQSISIFCYLQNLIIKEKNKNTLYIISKYVFGIYLIHMNPFIRTILIDNKYAFLSKITIWPFLVIIIAVLIFTGCLLFSVFLTNIEEYIYKIILAMCNSCIKIFKREKENV
jgi:surface polysaccharide O-acyltransferase-like enzyme